MLCFDVLRDDVVVAEGLRNGTKEDLVEGRGGDGSVVHACLLGACGANNRSKSGPGSRFQAIEFTRSAAALPAQTMRHMREVRSDNRLWSYPFDEHANFGKTKLAARNTLAS